MIGMAVMYVLCVDLHVVDVCGLFFSSKYGICSCVYWDAFLCIYRRCLKSVVYAWCLKVCAVCV